MSVVSATVCDLPMQIVSDRDRRRRRLIQIIWKASLKHYTHKLIPKDKLHDATVINNIANIKSHYSYKP